MADTLKRGRLSEEEKQYIRDNIQMPETKLASILSRSIEPIQKYVREYLEERQAATERAEKEKYSVENRHFWPLIQSEMSVEEQEYVKIEWAKYMSQFAANVTHTEEQQMINACRLSVLMSRSLQSNNQALKLLQASQALLEEELEKENPRENMIAKLQQAIGSYRAAMSSGTTEYDKLFKDYSSILKELRGTREQRIKEIEDNKETFWDLLRYLNRETNRVQESSEIALRKAAMDKEAERMAEPHTYLDGETDLPFLTTKSLKKLREKQKQQEREDDE